jgi:hypothetical protein
MRSRIANSSGRRKSPAPLLTPGNAMISSAFHRVLNFQSRFRGNIYRVPEPARMNPLVFFKHDGRPVHGMIRQTRSATPTGCQSSDRRHMHKELIVYLRIHAHDLVKLARQSSDETLSLELEKMAIEMLKRAGDLERDSRI